MHIFLFDPLAQFGHVYDNSQIASTLEAERACSSPLRSLRKSCFLQQRSRRTLGRTYEPCSIP